ncbi:MAG: DUF2279 domain-containing protein [Bacteroidales bacterium]|nr:DUF2279 domain-containing protein [Bacteroidales bacterium]
MNLQGQGDTLPWLRKWHYHSLMGAGIAGGLTYLHFAWYKNYTTESFHFFNDWPEWCGMDKVGHFFTAFYFSRAGFNMAHLASYNKRLSLYWSNFYALTFMGGFEVLDGFSEGWGFSWGDLLFDMLGILAADASLFLDSERVLILKFSFSSTKYASYNPKLLGSRWYYQILKDYNGQTYWLTFRPSSLFSRIPKWFGFSFGYGADGMVGASQNPLEINGIPIPQFSRKPQFFFSMDLSLAHLPVKNKYLKKFFEAVNILKFPAPTLEFNKQDKFKWHWLYF